MKTARSWLRRRQASVSALAALTAGALVLGTAMPGAVAVAGPKGHGTPRISAPPVVPKGCTGGIAPNPSVEQGSPPTGYTFEPASPVPPGTPSSKQPKLYTTGGYQYDGSKYALISTPDKMVSTAYETVKFVPGGVYTLTDWTGTHADNIQRKDQQFSGLRFYDAGGAQVLENKLPIDHDVAIDDKVARKDFPPSTAPANAASVKFFVSTNYDWAKWDCVYLQLAAYSVKKEVQNPDTGAWGPSATITAGETAHYRVTVTNEGTQPLTGITVKDPWCASQPAPFDLAAGANNAVTCDHPNVTMADDKHVNTATVTGAKYPDGTLGDKTATSTIMVKEAPPIDKVGDFVWIDKNRDGIQDTGEPGVQGVKVTLKDGAGGTVATATTDANGKYLFDKLKDGTYQVCFDVANLPAAVAGYQVTKKDAGGDDTKDSDAGPDGCTATTTLGASKREDLTLDLGLTPPTNKLGDFVWADTDKNGVQDTGEPGVQGVKVTLKDGTGATVGTTTTGADGKYLFDGLNDGTYTVCFDMASLPADYAGYQLTKKDAGGDDTKDSDADPATTCTPPTTLGADKREDLTLDAGIVSPPNKVGDFVWVDKNKNGVQDPGEPGVQGVTVTLKTGDGTLVTTTTTDANGKYLFDGLNDGTYIVCFDIAHLPPAMAGYLVTKQNVGDDAKDSDADLSTGCTPPTTVGKDKREDLTLDLGLIPPANRLGDFVWADTNKNGVQDTGEPGVPGVTVTLKNGTTTVATTTTGADGKYLFDNLDDGTYTVCFDMAKLPADYTGYALTKKDAGGDDAKDSDAGTDGCTPPTTLGDTKHEDLTLDAGIVSPPNRLGDYVWVDKNKNGLQDDGEPAVPGVKATLQDGTGKPVGTATTDANGKYLFDNLDDGTYTVCFDIKNLPAAVAGYQVTKQNAGDVTKDSDADASTGCTKPTTLGKDKREDLTLDMGLVAPVNRLGDYVWADTNKNGLQDTGEPGVQGVKVTLQDGTGKPVGTATTDANGKYLFDNLDDGTYTVCFDVKALPDKYADNVLTKTGAAGFNGTDSAADQTSACTKPTTLGAAKREDLTLDAGIISPPNKVGDFVWADKNKNGIQDKDEIGVPGVKVTLKDDTGKTVGTVTTGTDGRYLFDNLPDGSYQVCFDMKALPGDFAEYQLTKVNAAGHNGTDSAADLSTGCTPVTKLGPGHREDLTLDAGLIAPVNRVGDYVWADKNANGIQDPGEPGVPGVKVTLKDDTGKTIATQSTADGGKYLFSDLPDGSYQVCFETSSAAGDLAGAALTKANAAGHNGTDSAADPASKCTPVTKLGAGHREDLTLDAGLVAPAVTPKNKLGDYVWYDANDNGIQDKGEEGVDGVKVTLKDGSGKVLSTTTTASGGKYLFGNLPDGSYQVCFDTSYASAEYRSYAFTKAGAAGRNGTDSAADPASKCTPVTKLGPGKREDLTLDAGLAGGHTPAAVSPKLASTGSPIDWFAGLGTLLLLGGFGLITLVRRRLRSTE
ncbi:MAG TPA: SdrD B-like domain-containing protein [Amycolatopsis sp.]|nr:SdrD B-like domain-containing protein [Amycolatopsis sp.]